MTDAVILSHFQKKQAWMASHVNNAQFPTRESQQGLTFYQASEFHPAIIDPEQRQKMSDVIGQPQWAIYPVDCHALMVRYAKTLSGKWPKSQQNTILEYLSQISLTDTPIPKDTDIQLYIIAQKGHAIATGMVFKTEEECGSVAGIYDIYGGDLSLQQTVKQYLLLQMNAAIIVSE